MDYHKIDLKVIVRYLNGYCSMQEEDQLRKWMKEDPENEKFLLFVKKIWDTSPDKRKHHDVDSAWLRFNEQFDLDDNSKTQESQFSKGQSITQKNNYKQSKRKSDSFHWMSWSAVAVTMILIVGMTFKYMNYEQLQIDSEIIEEIEFREIITNKGQRTRLRLSDGSTVQLNSESRLLIPETFNGVDSREVYLEGEAYFEITPDPDRQFVVKTDRTITKVLGTTFNINSYPFEDQVSVAVISGEVSLGELGADFSETISRHQLGILSSHGSLSISELSDLSQYTGWINGELIFIQDSLNTVQKKLERWYGIDIIIEIDGKDQPGRKLTATYTDRQRVEEVLESISIVFGLEFKQHSSLANTFTFYNNQH